MKLDEIFCLKNRHRFYLAGHALVIIVVILFFKFIPERKWAALCAGTLFLTGPLFVLITEFKVQLLFKSFSTYGALFFLGLSAIPIFFLRITNWDQAFESLSLFGFSGPELHHISNYLFYFMLMTFVADSMLANYKRKQKIDI